MHRSVNHVTRFKCKDVQASFLRHRAELMNEAEMRGLRIRTNDDTFFIAEGFDACNQRIWFQAGPIGSPFVHGPSVTRRIGEHEYSILLLPK